MSEYNKINDQWQTPQDLFDVLDKGGIYQGIEFKGFNFNIDLCASWDNYNCDVFFLDYLKNDFYIWGASNACYPEDYKDLLKDTACFMNPPYSNPKPFIEKAWDDSCYCRIVCLVKVDPSAQWWATFWDYGKCSNCSNNEGCYQCVYGEYHGEKRGAKVLYFPKRIKFDPPQQLIDSGEVYQVKGKERKDTPELNKAGFKTYDQKWVQKCKQCRANGTYNSAWFDEHDVKCEKCKGKGYILLSGPTFSAALLIFDRRGL